MINVKACRDAMEIVNAMGSSGKIKGHSFMVNKKSGAFLGVAIWFDEPITKEMLDAVKLDE